MCIDECLAIPFMSEWKLDRERENSRRSRSEHELAPSSTVSTSLRSILWGGLLHDLELGRYRDGVLLEEWSCLHPFGDPTIIDSSNMMFGWGGQKKGFWPLNLCHLLLLQVGQSPFSAFLHASMIWVGLQS